MGNKEKREVIYSAEVRATLGMIDDDIKKLVGCGHIRKYEPHSIHSNQYLYDKEDVLKYLKKYGYGRHSVTRKYTKKKKSLMGEYSTKFRQSTTRAPGKLKKFIESLSKEQRAMMEQYSVEFYKYVSDKSNELFSDEYNLMKYNIAANNAKLLEQVILKTGGSTKDCCILLGVSEREFQYMIDLYRLNFSTTLTNDRMRMLESMDAQFIKDHLDLDGIVDGINLEYFIKQKEILPFHPTHRS